MYKKLENASCDVVLLSLMEEKPKVIETSSDEGFLCNPDSILEKALSLSAGSKRNPALLDNDHCVLFFPYSDLCVVYAKNSESTLVDQILKSALHAISTLRVPTMPIFYDYSQNISENTGSAISSFGKVRHLSRFSVFRIRVSQVLENTGKHACQYSQAQCFEAIAACVSNLNLETSLTFTSEKSGILYCLFHKKPHLDAILAKPLVSQISALTGISQDYISLCSSNSIDEDVSIAGLLDVFIE